MTDIIEYTQDLEILTVDQNYNITDFQIKKEKLRMIAQRLKETEVTEENIKENKQLLKRIRKAVREIDEYRKDKRREALEPYNHLAKQVKELTEIIKEGEDEIDYQITRLEDIERDHKEQILEEIFKKRAQHYELIEDQDFENFLIPSYLNKSESITSVEKKMSEWLEETNEFYDNLKTFCEQNNINYENCKRDLVDSDWARSVSNFMKFVKLTTQQNTEEQTEFDQHAECSETNQTDTPTGETENHENETSTSQEQQNAETMHDLSADFATLIVRTEDLGRVKSLLSANKIDYQVFTNLS